MGNDQERIRKKVRLLLAAVVADDAVAVEEAGLP